MEVEREILWVEMFNRSQGQSAVGMRVLLGTGAGDRVTHTHTLGVG